MLIKLILIGCLAFLAWLLFRGPGSTNQTALRRLGIVLVAFGGMFTVIFPDSLTRVAQLVGVGRGTDLLLYAFVVFSSLVAIGFHQRIERLEAQMAELVRELAVLTAQFARKPDDGGEAP
ncbi:MAG: DUF2304 domain-containing protein [Nocardioides sp.]|nr:DUF2304 domain-containing protein [Nocardioides sp.]